MKPFILRRHFIWPFLLVFIAYTSINAWLFADLYWADFQHKGLPVTLFIQWILFIIGGGLFNHCFLVAFICGVVYWAHSMYKSFKERFNPFIRKQWLILLVLIAAAVIYQAYVYPAANIRSMKILSNVIYARDYESYKFFYEKDTTDIRNEKMKSLPELFREKKQNPGLGISTDLSDIPMESGPVRPDRNVLEIARRFVFPTTLFLFWIAGLLLARSFRGTYRIFPFLIGFLTTHFAWYLNQQAGELAAKRGDTTVFWGVFRLEIVLALFCTAWYFLLEKFQGTRKEAGNESVEQTGEKNGKNLL